ncbi:hypothetical protein [Clostridium sp.]|uniref:hypothetical protein n=1 Tax=Clostridium sp. TaxID=1506 RepID=UPI002FCAAB0E
MGGRDTNTKTEPHWENTEKGGSIVIGHEDEDFDISDKNDIKFVLTEVSERLGLNFISKVVIDDYGTDEEFYKCSRCGEVFDNQELDEENLAKFCYNCGAVLNWNDAIEVEDED